MMNKKQHIQLTELKVFIPELIFFPCFFFLLYKLFIIRIHFHLYLNNSKLYFQTKTMSKGKKNVPKGKSTGSVNNKLSQDMDNEIKDAFKFYDTQNTGYINRKQLRSILGNFGFTKMNGKQIEDQITALHNDKDSFSLSDVLEMIQKKWFEGRGREDQAMDMFALFDRKQKGLVGLAEIKQVFNQYLDIVISDNDIMEFIEEADLDKDGYLSQQEFFSKLGYQ